MCTDGFLGFWNSIRRWLLATESKNTVKTVGSRKALGNDQRSLEKFTIIFYLQCRVSTIVIEALDAKESLLLECYALLSFLYYHNKSSLEIFTTPTSYKIGYFCVSLLNYLAIRHVCVPYLYDHQTMSYVSHDFLKRPPLRDAKRGLPDSFSHPEFGEKFSRKHKFMPFGCNLPFSARLSRFCGSSLSRRFVVSFLKTCDVNSSLFLLLLLFLFSIFLPYVFIFIFLIFSLFLLSYWKNDSQTKHKNLYLREESKPGRSLAGLES